MKNCIKFTVLVLLCMSISCIKDQAFNLCEDENSYCGLRGQPFCQQVKLDSTVSFQFALDDVTGTNLLPDDGQFNAKVSGTNTSVTVNELVDSGATFTTDGLRSSFIVANLTTGDQALGNVISDTRINLSADIFTGGSPLDYAILNWGALADLGPPVETNATWEYVPNFPDNQLKIEDVVGLATGLSSPPVLTLNKAYRVVFTIRDYVSGTVAPNFSSISTFLEVSGNGTYEFSGVAYADIDVDFVFSVGAEMTIDDVQIYEIPRVGIKIAMEAGGTAVYTNEYFNDGNPAPFPNSPIYYINENVQIDLNFNDLGLPPGCYFIRVYDVSDPSTYLETQCLTVCEEPYCAVKLNWTNDEDIGGLVYTSTLPFTQELYIEGEFRNPTFNLPNERYKYSNGDTLLLTADRQTIRQLRIKEAPAYIHSAIASGLVLDNFAVNDEEQRLEGEGYQPQWRRNSRNAPAIVELTPKLENYKNNLC